jgi:CBS domain containing-hemolysin-like protein
MDVGLRLLAVVALIAANGFFVAAEFALVNARKTRIEQLAARGNRAALAVLRASDDRNARTKFLSACQLGVTVASLALGWVGENSIAEALEPLFAAVLPSWAPSGVSAHAVAVPVAFAFITFFTISLGELAPKMLALEKAEATALFATPIINVFGFIFGVFIRLLAGFTKQIVKLMGISWQAELTEVYTPEDLKGLIRSSRASGAINPDPDRMLERALDFTHHAAHHVMVPRTEMVAVPADVTIEQLAGILERHQHTRYPVFEGSSDNIIGVISAKNLAPAFVLSGQQPGSLFDVRRYMSPPLFVPETMRADRLLAEMKRNRSHLAIVVDEYGVTAGLVTLRDLLDRIAGEVRDEAEAQAPSVERLPDGAALVDGLALLRDVEMELGIPFGESDFDTLGGFIFGRLGRRPEVGDSIAVDGRTLIVEEMDGLRVARVRVPVPETAEESRSDPQAVSP